MFWPKQYENQTLLQFKLAAGDGGCYKKHYKILNFFFSCVDMVFADRIVLIIKEMSEEESWDRYIFVLIRNFVLNTSLFIGYILEQSTNES